MTQTHHHLVERPAPALLSIVVPAYNEQEVLGQLRRRLVDVMAALPCPTEILLVNDGSSDCTLEGLLEWAGADDRVTVIELARNFGHQAAVTAGLDLARGEAVVVMDADLQDPPEVIGAMLAEYGRGYDVVYARRRSRAGESAFKRFSAWAFYRFMRAFVHRDLPADTGDFRLISRACLDALKTMRETHRFLRGMVAWVGFPQIAVFFDRPARAAGRTKYSLGRMFRLAWIAALSFSPIPLRISLALGILVAAFGMALGIWAVIAWLMGDTTQGWTSLFVLVCLIGGAILISNGILGEYVGRIFEQSKARPLYVIARCINRPAANPAADVRPAHAAPATADVLLP